MRSVVGERPERVLGGAVVPLQRNRPVAQRAADVDDGAAVAAQVRHRRTAAVDLAPVVHVELPAHLLDATAP